MIGVSFHELVFTVNILLHFFVYLTCEIICKTKETIRIQNFAYYVSLIHHLYAFKKLKMGSQVVIPPKLNIYRIVKNF